MRVSALALKRKQWEPFAQWGERLHEMKQVGIEHHPEWAAKAK